MIGAGQEWSVPEGEAAREEALVELPDRAAVFLVHLREGAPLLARTASLRRRLRRLLGCGGKRLRLLDLSGVAERVEWWVTGSRLEAALVQYHLARKYFPDCYAQMLRLRAPYWVKLILSNAFPRTQTVQRLGGARSLYYGPFRTRAAAEQFEAGLLDLFQIRRCAEELTPSPEHPGCVYGEMHLCSRPCQEAVSEQEYAAEVERVKAFLTSGGQSLIHSLTALRDRLSEELDFEQAARQHKRLEKVEELLRGNEGIAGELSRLHGVVVAPAAEEGSVQLWFFRKGCWLEPQHYRREAGTRRPVSMDEWLRGVVEGLPEGERTRLETEEHVALLAKWYFSSWRDGLLYRFASFEEIPYRRIVRGISKIAAGGAGAAVEAAGQEKRHGVE